jgi:heme/copper-type cytochrome/quinol oxidase subunit 2
MLSNVIWVLAVIVFWLVVGSIVMVLVRFVARENDDEQTVCELTSGYYTDHLATV